MNRRTFFGGALASAATAIALKLGHSEPDVPQRVDCRIGACDAPVKVFHNGKHYEHVVAYDLREQWIIVVCEDPNGRMYVKDGVVAEETLRGNVVVRWDREQLAKERVT